jgi:nicotinamidase-related amidase
MTSLCRSSDSTLLIIDPQLRLMPSIDRADELMRRCVQLATAARELAVPVLGTEQNPAGLGPNAPEVKALCDSTFSKFHFSAAAEPGFLALLPPGRKTLVVAGCEAHVCVLQTVIGLLEAGYDVKLVTDAIGSRHAHNREAALARAGALGADLVTTEMLLFEWLATSQHPSFRTLSRLIR